MSVVGVVGVPATLDVPRRFISGPLQTNDTGFPPPIKAFEGRLFAGMTTSVEPGGIGHTCSECS
jgi:hypothetical protein